MGPISTGLGEIYLWTVEAEEGAQARRHAYTPTDLREIQDWVIKPQLRNVPASPRSTRSAASPRSTTSRRIRQAGVLRLTLADVVGAGAQQRQRRRRLHRARGEQYLIRAPGQVRTVDDIATSCCQRRRRADPHPDVGVVDIGRELRTGAATDNGAKWCWARCSC
jgi:cobalt-zinc-cadmium resistance protein CzcA